MVRAWAAMDLVVKDEDKQTVRQAQFRRSFWRRFTADYPARLEERRNRLRAYVEANPHMREHLNDWDKKETTP